MQRIKRGISSVLGTVIVVAITIALGALLYAYANGMFGNLTQTVSVSAQAHLVVNPTSGAAYLEYSLTNNGNIQVTITSITVNGISVNLPSGGIVLAPGQTYQNVAVLTSTTGTTGGASTTSFIPGNYYTVIFQGNTTTGKPFSIVQNVLASST